MAAAKKGMTRGDRIKLLFANKAAGEAFERQVEDQLRHDGFTVGRQITVVTTSGRRTRLDFVVCDRATGEIRLVEVKSSWRAKLNDNQEKAFAEILKDGARIVGEGKPYFPGGLPIDPSRVEILRPGLTLKPGGGFMYVG